MAEWICADKRLPKQEGKYLCYCTGIGSNSIDICYFAKNLYKIDKYDFKGKHRAGWFDYDSEYGYWEDDSVIAWMPLPEPPEKIKLKECESK